MHLITTNSAEIAFKAAISFHCKKTLGLQCCNTLRKCIVACDRKNNLENFSSISIRVSQVRSLIWWVANKVGSPI